MKYPFAKDFDLSKQIQRAVVSIMSNITKGFKRQVRTEFHQFLVIAKGYCIEAISLLFVTLDIGYIISENFGKVNELASEVDKTIIRGMRASVQKQKETIK